MPYDTYIVTDLVKRESQQELTAFYPTNHFKKFTRLFPYSKPKKHRTNYYGNSTSQ